MLNLWKELKGSKGKSRTLFPANKSCLFFQVDVHVLCTQDDIPSVETRGARYHQFMLNNLKIETHTVLVLDTVDNAFRLSAFAFFFFLQWIGDLLCHVLMDVVIFSLWPSLQILHSASEPSET